MPKGPIGASICTKLYASKNFSLLLTYKQTYLYLQIRPFVDEKNLMRCRRRRMAQSTPKSPTVKRTNFYSVLADRDYRGPAYLMGCMLETLVCSG